MCTASHVVTMHHLQKKRVNGTGQHPDRLSIDAIIVSSAAPIRSHEYLKYVASSYKHYRAAEY